MVIYSPSGDLRVFEPRRQQQTNNAENELRMYNWLYICSTYDGRTLYHLNRCGFLFNWLDLTPAAMDKGGRSTIHYCKLLFCYFIVAPQSYKSLPRVRWWLDWWRRLHVVHNNRKCSPTVVFNTMGTVAVVRQRFHRIIYQTYSYWLIQSRFIWYLFAIFIFCPLCCQMALSSFVRQCAHCNSSCSKISLSR